MEANVPGGTKATIDDVDCEIGRRIKTHRVAKGISQMQLGEAIGVTFQQIQKYEKGVNHVAPGRLQKIANHLNMPIASFYASMDRPRGGTNGLDYALVQSFGAIKLLRDFAKLKPSVQKPLVALVDVLTADQANLRVGKPMEAAYGDPPDRRQREG